MTSIRSILVPSVMASGERALAETKLPERPDYEAANRFFISAAGNVEARMNMKDSQRGLRP